MTDRDTFAAAALQGWLASQQTVISAASMARHAYEYADAMLRERDNHSEKPNSSPTLTDEEREAVEQADAYMSAAGCHNTNVQKTLRGLLERNDHDAVPEARAAEPESSVPPGSVAAPANTPEPVAWAVENASVATGLAWLVKREAVDFSFQHGGRIVPLYSHPQPTLTDAEREAVAYFAREFKGPKAAALRCLLERL